MTGRGTENGRTCKGKVTPLVFKIFLRFLFIVALYFSVGVNSYAISEDGEKTGGNGPFTLLEQRLADEGFDSCLLECVFGSGSLTFDARGAGLYFVHNESTLNYESFANETSIYLARQYMIRYSDQLAKVEEKFGVDKTMIAAIILVETGLGTFVGKRPVIGTLATMAALSDPGVRDGVWESLDESKRISREEFLKKSGAKSAWAYKELTAFLRYVDHEKIDPFSVKGSYAGAMGIPQFMPTNILCMAEDGNEDGVIDMFDHADAIASVANFLKTHGWRQDLDPEKTQEVLYAYNHSDPYVTILMRISKLLKGENG
jgi:membrane-bound lytic murein transglycosylase B